MTHRDLYTKFMIEYDKANVTSSYPSFTEYETATFLDKAYLALISQKVTGNNVRKIGFEKDLKSIEDLQALVKYTNISFIKTSDCAAENVTSANIPTDCLYFVSANIKYNIQTNAQYAEETLYNGTNTFSVNDYLEFLTTIKPLHYGTLQCRQGAMVNTNVQVKTYRQIDEHSETIISGEIHPNQYNYGMFEGGYSSYYTCPYYNDTSHIYSGYGDGVFTDGYVLDLADSRFNALKGILNRCSDEQPKIYVNFENHFPTEEQDVLVNYYLFDSEGIITYNSGQQHLPIDISPSDIKNNSLMLVQVIGAKTPFENNNLSVYYNSQQSPAFSNASLVYGAPYYKYKVTLDGSNDIVIINTNNGQSVYQSDMCGGIVVAYPKEQTEGNPTYLLPIASADYTISTIGSAFGEDGYISQRIKYLDQGQYTDENYDFYVFLNPNFIFNAAAESDIIKYALSSTIERIVPAAQVLDKSSVYNIQDLDNSTNLINDQTVEIKIGSGDTIQFIERYITSSGEAYDENDIRTLPIKMLNHDLASKFFVTPYNLPWIKTPVCYEEDNHLYLVYDPLKEQNYIFNRGFLTYIKKPNMFVKDQYDESLDCFDCPEDASDDIKSLYEFECEDTVAEELINLAIVFALENVQSQRLNTKLNTIGLES